MDSVEPHASYLARRSVDCDHRGPDCHPAGGVRGDVPWDTGESGGESPGLDVSRRTFEYVKFPRETVEEDG